MCVCGGGFLHFEYILGGLAGREHRFFVSCFVFVQTFVKAHHKVGVLRVKEGQRNEEDIFCNCHEGGPFDEFLNVLGKL